MVEVGLNETTRLNTVLSQFLDFARPRDPEMETFPTADTVRDVVDLQAELARRQGIAVTNQVSGSPQGFGDAAQVTQVLLNLVRNAIQATPDGGTIAVRCRDEDTSGRVVFEVEDTGCGIPPDLAESIYDPYVSGRDNGVGLGLSISALLIRQHGGTLSHEPGPMGGTVFRFDIPSAGGKR